MTFDSVGVQLLWASHRSRARWLHLTTPLTVPAFFLCDPYAIKLLSVTALVMAVLQYGVARFNQQQGNKVI